MPKTFYRRRSKLIPEDWTEEIEKWERVYRDKYFVELQRSKLLDEQRRKKIEERIAPLKIIWAMDREEDSEAALLDCDGEYCGHKTKIQMNAMIVCHDCGKELGRRYGRDVGYNNRNHVMRGYKKS